MAESIFRGTTICAVRKNGECAMAGDGQVTMGQQTVMKAHAHKVRRIYNGKVVVGFAGSVADAFALSEKFEEKLTQFSGNLPRAAVELLPAGGHPAVFSQAEAAAAAVRTFLEEHPVPENP